MTATSVVVAMDLDEDDAGGGETRAVPAAAAAAAPEVRCIAFEAKTAGGVVTAKYQRVAIDLAAGGAKCMAIGQTHALVYRDLDASATTHAVRMAAFGSMFRDVQGHVWLCRMADATAADGKDKKDGHARLVDMDEPRQNTTALDVAKALLEREQLLVEDVAKELWRHDVTAEWRR